MRKRSTEIVIVEVPSYMESIQSAMTLWEDQISLLTNNFEIKKA
jgi:hypothetical protein